MFSELEECLDIGEMLLQKLGCPISFLHADCHLHHHNKQIELDQTITTRIR